MNNTQFQELKKDIESFQKQIDLLCRKIIDLIEKIESLEIKINKIYGVIK